MTLDHAGLSVAALDAALAFYGPAFGFASAFAFLADPEGNLVELVERA